jgi:hypothetical protein
MVPSPLQPGRPPWFLPPRLVPHAPFKAKFLSEEERWRSNFGGFLGGADNTRLSAFLKWRQSDSKNSGVQKKKGEVKT